jgi:hypothetical protein
LANYTFTFHPGVLEVRKLTDIRQIIITIDDLLYKAIREADGSFSLTFTDHDCIADEVIIDVHPVYAATVVSIIHYGVEVHPEFTNPRLVSLNWMDNFFNIRVISTEDTDSYGDHVLRISRQARKADYVLETEVVYDCTPKFVTMTNPNGGDPLAVLYNGCHNIEPIDVGIYHITVEITPNCLLDVGTLTILPRPLIVIANNLIVSCDTDLSKTLENSYRITGFVCGDDENTLIEKPIVKIDGDINTLPLGLHENKVMVSGGKAENYIFVEHIFGTLRMACGEMLKITLTADPAESGLLFGAGDYNYGDNVVVWANPLSNTCSKHQFVNWSINGEVISTDNPFTFMATDDVNLVANFHGFELDFDTYAPTLWNNTFKLNLNRFKQDGYDVIGCRWFKNGIEEIDTRTINEFSYSAGPVRSDWLELAPTFYSFIVMTKSCGALFSTKKMITSYNAIPNELQNVGEIIAYPNPVLSGRSLTLEGIAKGSQINIYNRSGVLVKTTIATDHTTELTLRLPVGIYVIEADHKTIQIIVTE